MAPELYPAIFSGPYQPGLMADGRTINAGEEAEVTAGDLLSGHWTPKDRKGKQIVAAAEAPPEPEPVESTPVPAGDESEGKA